MTNCKCKNWARANQVLMTKHHPDCERYSMAEDTAEIVDALINGIIAWAADEDGVHPDCWEAFKNAAVFVGRFDVVNSKDDMEEG